MLIFSYTFVRASLLCITWDEAFSYLRYVRNGILVPAHYYEIMDANNHLLNTWLTMQLIKVFGVSEFVLRIPSLAAHVLFLFYSGKFAMHFKNQWFAVASFLVINLNPYLLDFFSLSRGYGLSVGFIMTAIYYLQMFILKEYKTKHAVLVMVFASLACFANFVALNFLVAVYGLLVVMWFVKVRLKNNVQQVSVLKSAAMPTVIFLLTLLIAVPITLKLKEAGALFYGGNRSFWKDTIGTLTDRCFYEVGYNYWFHRAAKGAMLLTFFSAAVFIVLKFARKKTGNGFAMLFALFFLLSVCSLSTIVQHYLFGTLYLFERTALFLLVLFSLLFVFFVNELAKDVKQTGIAIYLACVFAVIHFSLAFNFTHVLEWKWDADIKQMVSDLDKIKVVPNGKRNISMGVPQEFEMSINFYRAVNRLTWLNMPEGTRDVDMRNDYFFLSPLEYTRLNLDSFIIIKQYPQTKSILAKPKYPANIQHICFENKNEFTNTGGQFEMDELTEYSPACSYIINDSLTPDRNAIVLVNTIFSTSDKKKDNLFLILSFENKNGVYVWKRAYPKDYINTDKEWSEMNYSCLVPLDTKAGDELKAYFHNPNGQKAFIKSMELQWLCKETSLHGKL